MVHGSSSSHGTDKEKNPQEEFHLSRNNRVRSCLRFAYVRLSSFDSLVHTQNELYIRVGGTPCKCMDMYSTKCAVFEPFRRKRVSVKISGLSIVWKITYFWLKN